MLDEKPPDNKYQSQVFAADNHIEISDLEEDGAVLWMQGRQRMDCRFKSTCLHCQGRNPTVLHVHYGNNSQNEDYLQTTRIQMYISQ